MSEQKSATVPEPARDLDTERVVNSGFEDVSDLNPGGGFAHSSFVVNDFMSVVTRVSHFFPGTTQFSSTLPRTRYGEMLLEAMRQAGFSIVLGDSPNVPALRYTVELPSEHSPDIHTFFVSLGNLKLKRSYEIYGERIAPVSEMLMAGINPTSLRPVQNPVATRAHRSNESTSAIALSQRVKDQMGVPRINELVNKDDAWDPLAVNMYDTRESIYKPMFADSTRDYENVSSRVLEFPNDSLVLGDENKSYLFNLAQQVRRSEDIVRLVGCSHGKSQLDNGNEKLAKGRAIRVREELLLAGVQESAVLHEVCWANVHFDEQFPRRGVVVFHMRPRS